MTDTPKRIYAWSVPPTSNLVGTWCATLAEIDALMGGRHD